MEVGRRDGKITPQDQAHARDQRTVNLLSCELLFLHSFSSREKHDRKTAQEENKVLRKTNARLKDELQNKEDELKNKDEELKNKQLEIDELQNKEDKVSSLKIHSRAWALHSSDLCRYLILQMSCLV